ncbi:MAG: hypothetical protein O2960_08730 [Verrucomicrobia bacterium]|nr:hypothetical protein [Verrucomicrobiota bacterium]
MQVTIRRVEESWVAKAKAEAARRGVSMNEVLRDALAIGLAAKGERKRNTDLDKYARDSDFGPEWESFLEGDLKKIDDDLWN